MIEDDVLTEALELEASDVAEAGRIASNVLTQLEGWTERHFRELTEFVLRFNGGHQDIWLPEKPVQAEGDPLPALVVVESYDSGAWTTVPASDYEVIIHPRPYGAAVLQHATRWPAGKRNIRVTYSAGYAVGGLPKDIEQLVLEMTAQRWLDRGSENLRSETIGGYSYTRADGGMGEMRKDWKDTIDLWKHWALA